MILNTVTKSVIEKQRGQHKLYVFLWAIQAAMGTKQWFTA